jgi:transcriptional regulator with XRE-family HTH domain
VSVGDHACRMGSKERAVDRGARLGRRLITTMGSDLRLGRVSAGLSLEQVGRAVGMSHSQLGRIERADHPSVSVMQLARIASVVGLDLSVRTYPNGSPLRDEAHLALIQRFRARLSAKLSVRTEVPLPIAGDLRAWDLVVLGAGEPIGVEAETRLLDIQALERRIALKMRDGGLSRVILLVSTTRGNRMAGSAWTRTAARFVPDRGSNRPPVADRGSGSGRQLADPRLGTGGGREHDADNGH